MKILSSIILGITVLAPAGLAFAADPLSSVAATSATKAATPSVVPLETDGVGFGMNPDGVARIYDSWWDKRFVSKYQKTNPGPKTRELDYQLTEKKKALRRIANFDGRTTSFDKSEFREEFVHGTGETMTTAKVVRPVTADVDSKSVSYTRRFFFFQNKLWKIYDEYKLDAQGPFGADFKEAAARVEASAGAGAKRTRGPESQFENVVFETPSTRVRVVKLPSNRIAVVRSDNALAREVLDRREQMQKQVAEAPLDEDIQAVIR